MEGRHSFAIGIEWKLHQPRCCAFESLLVEAGLGRDAPQRNFSGIADDVALRAVVSIVAKGHRRE